MGWRDRDYSQTGDPADAPRLNTLPLPPRGTTGLLVLHLVALLMVGMLRADEGRAAASALLLNAESAGWFAWLLHPLAIGLYSGWPITLAITLFVIWHVGGHIERRRDATTVLTLYVLGTVFAGLAFTGVRALHPPLATYPLAMPLGAFAAWVYYIAGVLEDEYVVLFGRLVSRRKATLITGVVLVALALLSSGAGSTAWVLAAIAGAGAGPALRYMPRLRVPLDALGDAMRSEEKSEPPPAVPPLDESEIDRLLAKISREGLEALTPDERARLESARQAKLRGQA